MTVINLGSRRIEKTNAASDWSAADMLESAHSKVKQGCTKGIFIGQSENSIEILVAGMDKHQTLIALDSAYRWYLENC
jgi:hypothetical protein